MTRSLTCWLCCLLVCLLALGWPTASLHAVEDHPAGASSDHGEHAEGGLPMNFRTDLALWSVVTFAVFLFVLTKFAWLPLNKALEQREAKIRQDIADAESHRIKAEALLREHEAKLAKVQDEVKEILAEARRDAEYTKQDIMAVAQREAEASRQRAVADIRQAKDVALAELFDFVSSNVMQATERVLQRSLTGEDQERLVREALSELNVRRN